MFQINEESSTLKHTQHSRQRSSSRKKSIQEETLEEQLRDTLVRTNQLMSSQSEPTVARQCGHLAELVKSVAAAGSSSKGQEVVAALQVLLKDAVPAVAPLVSQLLLVFARVNRQHDYDAVLMDASRDLAAESHVSSSTSLCAASLKSLHENTVMCRICEQRVAWEALQSHTRYCCAKEAGPNEGKLSKASIDDFEVLKAISEGAFGSAHLARKVSSGDLFCIKRLRKVRDSSLVRETPLNAAISRKRDSS